MVVLITSDVYMNCSDAVNYQLWWDFKQMAVDKSVTRLCLGVNTMPRQKQLTVTESIQWVEFCLNTLQNIVLKCTEVRTAENNDLWIFLSKVFSAGASGWDACQDGNS